MGALALSTTHIPIYHAKEPSVALRDGNMPTASEQNVHFQIQSNFGLPILWVT